MLTSTRVSGIVRAQGSRSVAPAAHLCTPQPVKRFSLARTVVRFRDESKESTDQFASKAEDLVERARKAGQENATAFSKENNDKSKSQAAPPSGPQGDIVKASGDDLPSEEQESAAIRLVKQDVGPVIESEHEKASNKQSDHSNQSTPQNFGANKDKDGDSSKEQSVPPSGLQGDVVKASGDDLPAEEQESAAIRLVKQDVGPVSESTQLKERSSSSVASLDTPVLVTKGDFFEENKVEYSPVAEAVETTDGAFFKDTTTEFSPVAAVIEQDPHAEGFFEENSVYKTEYSPVAEAISEDEDKLGSLKPYTPVAETLEKQVEAFPSNPPHGQPGHVHHPGDEFFVTNPPHGQPGHIHHPGDEVFAQSTAPAPTNLGDQKEPASYVMAHLKEGAADTAASAQQGVANFADGVTSTAQQGVQGAEHVLERGQQQAAQAVHQVEAKVEEKKEQFETKAEEIAARTGLEAGQSFMANAADKVQGLFHAVEILVADGNPDEVDGIKSVDTE